MNLQIIFDRMIAVFSVCYPFKIISAIVLLIAILVVHLRLSFRIRHILLCNKPMHKHQLASDAYTKISLSVFLRFYPLPGMLADNFSVLCYFVIVNCVLFVNSRHINPLLYYIIPQRGIDFKWCRGLVDGLYLFTVYALPLTVVPTAFGSG